MKIPLRFQNTEYDCATTTFINALAYLYDREEFPVELLKKIYKYTLDVNGIDGVEGTGGTSKKCANKLANIFIDYSVRNNFDLKCSILSKQEVNIGSMKKCLDKNGVIIARCWQSNEHYVLITKIDDNFVYLFDPYYLEDSYYVNDEDVAIIQNERFTHNRLVKISRLFDDKKKDFSLLSIEEREVILINRD